MGYTREQREAKKQAEMDSLKSKENTNSDSKVENSVVIKEDLKPIKEKKKNISIASIPSYTNVLVRSNCFGQLIYVSTKTRQQIEWDNTTTPQYMSLDELLVMRNSQKKFFESAWVAIDGFVDKEYADLFSVEDILDYLQVKQYYKNALCPENIDNLFTMSPEEIEKRIVNSSSNSKDMIIIRANEFIQSGKLDSLKVITALEKALNCELDRLSS